MTAPVDRSGSAVSPKKIWTQKDDDELRICVSAMPVACRISWTKCSVLMGNRRSAKQCRDRWFNHVCPNSTKGQWTIEEDMKVIELQSLYGNKWTMIASFYPGRSDYEIRRRWHSVSKVMWSKKEDDQLKEHVSAMPKIGRKMNDQWIQVSQHISHRGAKQCLDRWFNHLSPKLEEWTTEEDERIMDMQSRYGSRWGFISSFLAGRSELVIQNRWHALKINSMHFSQNTNANENTVTKAVTSQSSPLSTTTSIPQENKNDHTGHINESTSGTQTLANITDNASKSLSVGAMNEKKYIPTKGINVPGMVASQVSHPPLTSAHLKELTDNSTPKLSPPPDCSIISIPSDEGEDLSEDEPASCADAIAFASSLINADDNEWLCYSSGSESSDDNMDDDMIQGFA